MLILLTIYGISLCQRGTHNGGYKDVGDANLFNIAHVVNREGISFSSINSMVKYSMEELQQRYDSEL